MGGPGNAAQPPPAAAFIGYHTIFHDINFIHPGRKDPHLTIPEENNLVTHTAFCW
jgi:hypothetical protein